MSALHLPRVSCFCLICANLEVDARFSILPSGKVFKGDEDDYSMDENHKNWPLDCKYDDGRFSDYFPRGGML